MDQRLRRLGDHLRGKRHASEFDVATVAADLIPHLFVLDVEPWAETVRLRVRLVGAALDAAFAQPVTGRHLEDFIHGPRAADVMEGFHHCAIAHEGIWMRQVVRIRAKLPRFVEGIVFYLRPDRLYGGLVVGELPTDVSEGSFESYPVY